jgi:hypothetical protein
MVFRPLRRRPILRGSMTAGVGYQVGSKGEEGRQRNAEGEAHLAALDQQQAGEPSSSGHQSAPAEDQPAVAPDSVAAQLTLLKGLLDQGALTQEEFDSQKAKLLAA